MTNQKGKIFFLALLVMAITVSTASASWTVNQIDSTWDDGLITETGLKEFEGYWISIKPYPISGNSYFAFRGVDIPANASINNAYLELTGSAYYQNPDVIPATIYGIDLPWLRDSWDPTPDLNSAPGTSAFYNIDLDTLRDGNSVNFTVTNIVKEIYGIFLWERGSESGGDIAFRISVVADPEYPVRRRFVEDYGTNPLRAAKLYIQINEASSTEGNGTSSETIYYKDYKIVANVTGAGAVLTWTNYTGDSFQLTTVEGDNVKTVTMPGYWYSQQNAPDSAASVGDGIYFILKNVTAPWNTWLVRTTDKGDTLVNLGEVASHNMDSPAAQHYAIAFDEVDTLHIIYDHDWDAMYRNYTISSGVFSEELKIFDGGYNDNQVRAHWDSNHSTIWFTRYGGLESGSQRNPSVLRRATGGEWENYTMTGLDRRTNDIINIGEDVYWLIDSYYGSPTQGYLKLYKLGNYSDLSDWSNIGDRVGGWSGVITYEVDLGIYFGYPAVIASLYEGSNKDTFGAAYFTGSSWNSKVLDLIDYDSPKPEFNYPKFYYDNNTNLYVAGLAIRPGDSAVFTAPFYFFIGGLSEFTPMYEINKRSILYTSDSINALGGDMHPTLLGVFTEFTIYDENGTIITSDCLDQATSLEEIQACIDDVVGQDPDDPNPPGDNWPDDDGFGQVTRFNLRFFIWAIGWFCIFTPLFAAAYKGHDFKMYMVFFIMIMIGFGLLWSLGSI